MSLWERAWFFILNLIFLGVATEEITKLVSETCAYMAIIHPDYTMLANRVSVDALHKRTSSDIREVATTLF
jgi:ribonucleoside-diphosphate reductase subunit M1